MSKKEVLERMKNCRNVTWESVARVEALGYSNCQVDFDGFLCTLHLACFQCSNMLDDPRFVYGADLIGFHL